MQSQKIVNDTIFKKSKSDVPIFPVIDNYYAQLCKSTNKLSTQAINDFLIDSLQKFGYDGMIAHFNPQNFLRFNLKDSKTINGKYSLNYEIDHEKYVQELNCIRRVVTKIGHNYHLTVPLKSPFEMAAILLTPSIFYVDLLEKEDYIIEIINCCYTILSEISTDLINLGIDSITVKDSLASPSMISPDLYRKFAFPFEKKLIEHIQKKIPAILHICQNSKPILLDMVQTGACVLEIDYPVDLFSALSIINNKATIKGNLNASLLECDTIENIERIVTEKICIAQDAPFILSTGDSVSPLTPDINLRHLVEVVKKRMY